MYFIYSRISKRVYKTKLVVEHQTLLFFTLITMIWKHYYIRKPGTGVYFTTERANTERENRLHINALHFSNLQVIPDREENLCVNDHPILGHVADGFANTVQATVSTFSSTGIDTCKTWIHIGVCQKKGSRCALGMTFGVK